MDSVDRAHSSLPSSTTEFIGVKPHLKLPYYCTAIVNLLSKILGVSLKKLGSVLYTRVSRPQGIIFFEFT